MSLSSKSKSLWQTIDWPTIVLYVILLIIGWFSIRAASFEFSEVNTVDLASRPGMQLVWIAVSIIAVFIIMMLDKDFFETFANPLYVLTILVLIATIFIASDVKGSRSWLNLGLFNVQPAEFAKYAAALSLAKLMSTYGFSLRRIKDALTVVSIILLPMLCIILQKETGSALVFLAFFLVLYREGMSGYILGVGIFLVLFFIVNMRFSQIMLAENTSLGEFVVQCIILATSATLIYFTNKQKRFLIISLSSISVSVAVIFSLSLFDFKVNPIWISLTLIVVLVVYSVIQTITNFTMKYALIGVFALCSLGYLYSTDYVFNKMLQPHQQIRILDFLGLKDDPTGAGYNVNQSKIAIGSGKLLGKGYLNGTQTKLKFVPEQDTDFIFCTIGEEHGFIGSSAVVLLFCVFIGRLYWLAEQQNTVFARVFGYSVASVFLFHLTINIGMVTGLTPVIGIPLPFFSYGGSSLLGFTLLLFTFLRLDTSKAKR